MAGNRIFDRAIIAVLPAVLFLPGRSAFAQAVDDSSVCSIERDHCAAQVSASEMYTCALTRTGHVFCWGAGGLGVLGNGSTANALFPVQVPGLGDIVQVSAGGYHTCAVRADGTLWCWGRNDDGEMGNGTYGAGLVDLTPIQVTALGNSVTQVSVGERFTCVRRTDGTAWCWGYNVDGELGLGFFSNMPPNATNVSTPTQVTTLGSDVAEVSCGKADGCAVKTDGTLWCWGSDGFGQLGDGQSGYAENATPRPVTQLGQEVASGLAGWLMTCAVLKDHSLSCWGLEGVGDLGLPSTAGPDTTPQAVTALDHRVRSVAGGYQHACAIERVSERLECWGDVQDNAIDQAFPIYHLHNLLPEPVPFPADRAVDVSIGKTHTCAIRPGGQLFCWGANLFGELGVGDTSQRTAPAAVPLSCGEESVPPPSLVP